MRKQRTISRKIAARAMFAGLCLGTMSAAGFAQSAATAGSASANANLASVAGAVSHIDTKGESLHVLVGRSLFVTTKSRLRRVYVSNPAVLDSFTASPYQIVVTAKAAGISSLILWNENGESQVYLVSSDIDVEGLRKSLHEALPNDNIVVESREGQVSLSGTVPSDATADAAMKLAGAYSKDVADSLLVNPAHTKQVKLRVRFVEIDRSKIDQAGFNFFSVGKNTTNSTTGQFPSVTANSQSGSSSSSSGSGSSTTSSLLALSDPLNILYYNSALGLGSVLKDLEDKQVLQILAEPTISSISGQKASFLSGGEFPFPVVQGGTGGFTSVTVQFRPYGVKLDFTPLVTPQGTISLKVSPEVSALDYSNAVTISGYTIPALSTRRAETQVELKDGQSFAISGLLDRRLTDILEKSPGFSSIPILGAFFKSKNYNHAVTELLVIVTPTIVDPLTDSTQPVEPKMPVEMMDPAKFDQQLAPRKPIASVLKP